MVDTTTTFKLKRDTAANWASNNPILAFGEPAWETDTGITKMGDGATSYNSLQARVPTTQKTTRSATAIIAAYDSSTKSKDQADYVCTGANDQVVMQDAIDSLQKGKLLLLDGTYNLKPDTSFYEGDWYAALFLENKNNIRLEGCGAGTVMSLPNSATVKNFALVVEAPCSNIQIQNIKFDCTGSTSTANQGAIFYNSSTGSSGSITNLLVQNCVFDGGRSFVIWGDGVNAKRFNILNNIFTSSHINSYGVAFHNSPCYANISNNIFNVAGGVFLDSLYGVNVIGNVMSGIRANGVYAYDYVRECNISYNYIETSLTENTVKLVEISDKNSPELASTRNTISNNILKGAGGASYGLYIKRGTDNTLFNNRIYNVGVPVFNGGTGNKISNNPGYATENTGTSTITAGQTSVVVNHGLTAAPTNIIVTPFGNVGNVWVPSTSITSTQFTINCSSAPASDTTVSWSSNV